MSVLAGVFKFESRGDRPRQMSPGLFDFMGFGNGIKKATAKSAMTLAAFYNGCDQLSNDIAKLPKGVFKKDGDKRIRFSDHPVNYLISQRPNDMMNAFDFWKIIELSKIIKGNAFVEIIWNDKNGYPESLVFLDHDDVEVVVSGKKLFYKYENRTIPGADMLHFKGFSFDGIVGVGVITFAAAALGISLSAQGYISELYADKGMTYGVIESDQPITSENKKLIESGFAAKMAQPQKHKVPMLDAGLKYKSITVTPAEAEFVETNKQGGLEICRWLNIAPHKLKILDNANYSNIYHQSIEHTQDSLQPRVTSNEQECDNKLFAKSDAGIIFCKFNIKALLRGDLDMQQKYYTSMIYSGAMTRNEVRALEDMNPIDGLDEPLQPVNMTAISQLTENMKNNK